MSWFTVAALALAASLGPGPVPSYIPGGGGGGDVCSPSTVQQCHASQGSLPPDNYTATTALACCGICAGDPACVGYIWNQGRCHLKGSTAHVPTGCKANAPAGCLACGLTKPPPPPPPPPPPAPKGAKNVLFMVSDDFRPSSGKYGVAQASTPHLDQLAETGILFTHAHVQFSYCAPSRNSFMSGRRPDANKVYNFNNHFREANVGENWTALPEHFVKNGYLVTGAGKLFHPGVPPNFDEPRSWSQTAPDGTPWPYADTPRGANASTECNNTGLAFKDDHFCLTRPSAHSRESGNATYLQDEAVVNQVRDRLHVAIDNWKATGQPFFVGIGTHRPHLPWVYPRPFFDRIPTDVPEAVHKQWPDAVPHIGFHDCAEMSHAYFDSSGQGVAFSNNSFTGHQSLMRRAYYGCLAYADNLLGQLLDILDETGAAASTIVTHIGDHGWHLGEHDMWCKMSTLELGTRIPFLIRAPWITSAVGVSTSALAEAVDLYPTLSELAGLALPTGPGGEHLGGVSLVPVMKDPAGPGVKNATLSQFPRCWQNNTHHTARAPGDESNHTNSWESMSDCHWTDRAFIDYMGYKMRTPSFSITQWTRWDGAALASIWTEPVGTELYDHRTDDGIAPAAFDDYENVNLHGNPEFAEIEAQLLAQLKALVAKWRTPWPPAKIA